MNNIEEISGLSKLIKDFSVQILPDTEDIYKLIDTIFEKNLPTTAFYLVDIGEIVRQYKLWRELFPNIHPLYAVKCNPNPVICKVLALLNVGFDVASKNEISLVKDIVFDTSKIFYANPYKESSSIQYARTNDIDYSVFDSEYELYKLKLYHPKCKLLMRIKVNDIASECRFSEKFGTEINDAKRILQIAKILELDIVGVHFHVGSSCHDGKQYLEALEIVRKIFDIGLELGYNMKIIDIGGGFPGIRDEYSINLLKNISDNVHLGIEKYFNHIDDLEIFAEPGRFFVQTSHTLLLNVIGKKTKIDENTGEKIFYYYMNDGIYGSFNCIIFDHQKPEILPYNERNEHKYKSIVFGPTCDSVDKINSELYLPELEIGEWCFVKNFGAYTVASSSDFNGFTKTKCFYIFTDEYHKETNQNK
jgi:diaminopimelate decarboxylase